MGHDTKHKLCVFAFIFSFNLLRLISLLLIENKTIFLMRRGKTHWLIPVTDIKFAIQKFLLKTSMPCHIQAIIWSCCLDMEQVVYTASQNNKHK